MKSADEFIDKYVNALGSLGTMTPALESRGRNVENQAMKGRENASQPHGLKSMEVARARR